MNKLKVSFFEGEDVVEIAKSLLGCFLLTNIDNVITGGLITETEAYNGITDKASHAYGGRLTQRTRTMYLSGGFSYVYLCYGIHNLLNVVTGPAGVPTAVLIRGIYPMIGIQHMQMRAGKEVSGYELTNGPGKLTRSLGVTLQHNAVNYQSDIIWIEKRKQDIFEDDIKTGPRIGVAYAGKDALLPYRFLLEHEKYL